MKPKLEAVKAMFPSAEERRGKIWLADMTVDKMLDGIPLSFTRRRYGAGGLYPMTYTWVEAYIGDKWVSLGDPWPCLMPPTSGITGLREALKRHGPTLFDVAPAPVSPRRIVPIELTAEEEQEAREIAVIIDEVDRDIANGTKDTSNMRRYRWNPPE